ncbi:MAG: histone deacetylase [Candidatus Riflebacteria bacterium]|nr:histone deacetylase [Candidatus Riflebacteria bacterium]
MKANRTLGIVFFPAFDWAISPTHPEREERLLYTMDQLHEEGITDIEGIDFYNPVIATPEDIQRVHFAVPDVKSRLTKSHMVSIGGAIEAYDLVFSKRAERSFALVRPPGHHAHRVVYGDRGFCIVNNEAVALEKMRAKYGDLRVAIIDTDCHHGDGTEDIYWNDPDTLLISFHQDGRTLFPGTGSLDDAGGPSAYGYNINIPLPPGTGAEGFLYVLDNVVMPILDEYKPDLIINSAGQDNHYSDPITNMNFTAQGYALLNEKLNPDIAVLEGGYSIQGALPYVNLGIILAMAGMDYSGIIEPDYNPKALKQEPQITEYIKVISQAAYTRWQNRDRLRDQKYAGKQVVAKNKRIYYDTDGIMENQTCEYYVCDSCHGYSVTHSSCDRGYKIKAITASRKACYSCMEKAMKEYDSAGKGFTNVYMQDRKNDKYLSK